MLYCPLPHILYAFSKPLPEPSCPYNPHSGQPVSAWRRDGGILLQPMELSGIGQYIQAKQHEIKINWQRQVDLCEFEASQGYIENKQTNKQTKIKI